MEQAADRYTPVMAQWGIPDPRQASEYPGDKTPMAQWAWEFLRRRHDYRKQWLTTVAPYLRADGEFDERAWERDKEKIFRQAAMAWQSCRIENPFDVLARNFGLHSTTGGFDPRRAQRPMFEAHFISVESWRGAQTRQKELDRLEQEHGQKLPDELRRAILEPPPWPLGEHECRVTFNVSLPLKPQFAAAEKILRDFVREVPPDRLVQASRPRPRTFTRYLRVLDFDTVGEMEAIIGEHLFPKLAVLPRRAAVRNSRDAAEGWQRDFLSLVATAKRRD